MSSKHPIIAVTGSSGAGTTTVRHAFSDIFRREGINAVFVEGDSFRRYGRHEMKKAVDASIAAGTPISHFGPEANLFEEMESLFRTYGEEGSGRIRHYVQNDEVGFYGQEAGTFTPWQPIPRDSDLLFYEGLHGGVVADTWTRRKMSAPHNPLVIEERRRMEHAEHKGADVAQWVDLLIGVVPIVNLEWIQKIHRDVARKNRTPESVTVTILRRMRDYISFIVPQFSLTDINFQRVPLVDTSNPFIARDIPTPDESIVVIRFREPKKHRFPPLLRQIRGSFMSRPNTLVAPGGEMGNAMEIICTPLIHEMVERKRRLAD